MDSQKVFDLSMEFSQKIWDSVTAWNDFEKDTIGNQFNIFSRGSLFETHCWLEKAMNRGLITKLQFDELKKDYELLHFEINKIIKHTREQLAK